MIVLTWFALYCASRSELRVEQTIRDELGMEAYCPTLMKWHAPDAKRLALDPNNKRIVRWPLLPGYVFTGLVQDAHGDFPFPALTAIDGVVCFVSANGKPARLRYDAPDDVLRRERWIRSWGCEPPARKLTIGEIRSMEQSGAFDFTADAAKAKRAMRKAKRILKGFEGLDVAMKEAA